MNLHSAVTDVVNRCTDLSNRPDTNCLTGTVHPSRYAEQCAQLNTLPLCMLNSSAVTILRVFSVNVQGPLILVSRIEELLERKNSGSGLEIEDYGRRDPPC
jgi:hypothetical protein